MTNPIPHDPVPLAYPQGEVSDLRSEIAAALMRVVDGKAYILGPEVAAFEKAMADHLGVAEVVGVASGTDALVLAMLALGVKPGDEVITVSHTAGPTVAAICMIGATPVLVDVEAASYCIDPRAIGAALGPRTRAIIAVHLYGQPADIAAIRAAAPGTPIIEDCAQAQGANVGGKAAGSLSEISCFSFYPTKNLGAIGDGGAVASNDTHLARRVRVLRTYGWTQPQFSELEYGRCSRLDEIQGSLLSVKLKALSGYMARRRAIAGRYRDCLSDLPLTLPAEKPDTAHAYHLYVVRSDHRDALESHLAGEAIGTGRHYRFPVHRQPGLAARARIPAPLAVTEEISTTILSLPMFSTMSEKQIDRVIEAVRKFFL